MTSFEINSWHDVQSEVLSRINSKCWKPGDLIPKEADLAREFGCARATVNRALQSVAEQGLLDRRRKAGTRVAVHPIRKATLSIPIIRHEIEERGQSFSYTLNSRTIEMPTVEIRTQLDLAEDATALNVKALYLADGQPYVYEDRWVNIGEVPSILDVDLAKHNTNEWLVANAPYTRGDFSFSALCADKVMAERLNAKQGDALFVIDRKTWNKNMAITTVRLVFHTSYQMKTTA